YPVSRGRNKPATFFSADGVCWDPPSATRQQLIQLNGYDNFADADVNGVNVLLFEAGHYRVYFADFRAFGKTWRAGSDDGRSFRLDGKVLDGSAMINDVKKFRVAGRDWYLMGLHVNGDRLLYTLSDDGLKFPPPRTLCEHAGDA